LLYWGDVNIRQENKLRCLLDTDIWDQVWFRKIRENQIMQFIGDAALYTSRSVGSEVIEKLKQQAVDGLSGFHQDTDRLHLITHSWGTIILFDALFASRWDDATIPGYGAAQGLRLALCGGAAREQDDFVVRSVTTMGSPLALFSLMDADQSDVNTPGNTHDITPGFQRWLESLQHKLAGNKLPWTNFVHPGDPIAYPVEKLLPDLIDQQGTYLAVKDWLLHQPFESILHLNAASLLDLLQSGQAHHSYWESSFVAQKIADVINA
jgi:hypothetical protein